MSDLVRFERDGAIGRITLDRPPLNILTIPMLRGLDDALARAAAERGLRVLALAGAGKAFCAGVDVADHTADRVPGMLEVFHGAVRRLLALELPTAALVHGAALGGGCELALACDVVLAREDAKVGQPEIRLGVFPPVAAALLPRLVGRQRALELVLSGRILTAAEAERMDLVARVFAAASYEADARAWLEAVAALSGPSLRLAKRAVLAGLDRPLEPALAAAEALYLQDLMATPDAREGIAAFLEKREPRWREA